jgi:hypothetical protein
MPAERHARRHEMSIQHSKKRIATKGIVVITDGNDNSSLLSMSGS